MVQWIGVHDKSPDKYTYYPLVESGSVVLLSIDNGDGGIGITLAYDEKRQLYRVYRLPPHDDYILVMPYECYVEWTPGSSS